MIDPNQRVADLVLEHSECAAVFQRYRIDYCCSGEMSVADACEKRGIDLDELSAALTKAIEERSESQGPDLRDLTTPELIDYIVNKHHAYLREALPFLEPLAAKVGRVHGPNEQRLIKLYGIVMGLSDALLPHLEREEEELFPLLTDADADADKINAELSTMHQEHLEVAELLEAMRETTEDFRLPMSACNSYRTLFTELQTLESDILEHVHLETHVLKPRFDAA